MPKNSSFRWIVLAKYLRVNSSITSGNRKISAKVSWRRLKVPKSGTGQSKSVRRSKHPTKPVVCRSAIQTISGSNQIVVDALLQGSVADRPVLALGRWPLFTEQMRPFASSTVVAAEHLE